MEVTQVTKVTRSSRAGKVNHAMAAFRQGLRVARVDVAGPSTLAECRAMQVAEIQQTGWPCGPSPPVRPTVLRSGPMPVFA